MRLLCVLLFMTAALPQGFAQKSWQLSGFVKDASSGETLIGAYVYLRMDGKVQGVSTNTYGFYSIRVKEGTSVISTSMLGYHSITDTLHVSSDEQLDVKLQPKEYVMKEATVSAPRDSSVIHTELTHLRVERRTLLMAPRLTGEADVMKTLQYLPGIKQGGEGSAGLHIRGGSPDQNLIVLDGVPVYNIYHALGYLSVFNTEAIKDVRIYKSGMPSRYERRLSSVIDISLKEGDIFKSKKNFVVSPIAGSFLWEGPLKEGKSSFILTGRRTWLDALARLATFGEEAQRGYYFYDISGKLNFLLNPRNRLFISAYSSADKFYDRINDRSVKGVFGLRWGNQTVVARHTYQLRPKAFLSNLVYFSRYNFTQQNSYSSREGKQSSSITSFIRDINFRSQLEYFPTNNQQLTAGVELGLRRFRPEIVQELTGQKELSARMEENTSSRSINLFVEDVLTFEKTELFLGVRQSTYLLKDKSYFHIQPHGLLSYRIFPGMKVKLAYDNMVQYLHLLTNSTLGQPTDLWVPATGKVPPQRSQQLSLGVDYNTSAKNYSFSVEGYLKKMDKVIEYKEGANYLYGMQNSWEEKVTIGDGFARGIELMAKKNQGMFTGWVAYTLSGSERLFEDLNNGKKFPYKYDRRHDVSIVSILELNQKNRFSAAFTYNTGNALTLPLASVQQPMPPFGGYNTGYLERILNAQPLYRERNNFRMPAYHRLDLSYHHTKELGKNRSRSWVFSVYNVYNRLNPYMIYESGGKLRQYAFFPIIPSVAYKREF